MTQLIPCSSCGDPISLPEGQEPQYCCDGRECGCLGMPINIIFCKNCWDNLFEGEEDANEII